MNGSAKRLAEVTAGGRAEGRVLPEREARGAAGANRVRIESGHWLLNGGRQPPNRPTAHAQGQAHATNS